MADMSGVQNGAHFGRRDVTRGFSHPRITSYNEWLRRSGIDDHGSVVRYSMLHTASVPLLTVVLALTLRHIPYRHHSLLFSIPPRRGYHQAARLESCLHPVRPPYTLPLGPLARQRASSPTTRDSSKIAHGAKYPWRMLALISTIWQTWRMICGRCTIAREGIPMENLTRMCVGRMRIDDRLPDMCD